MEDTTLEARETLEIAVVDATLKSESLDLVAQLGNLGLSELADTELAEKIPWLGILVKVCKVGLGVRDALFAKKLVQFMNPLSSVTNEQRREFSERMERDPDLRRRVGETLILLLDRLDDMDKPELLGRAYRALLAGAIDFETFRRLGAAIDQCFTEDLRELLHVANDKLEREGVSSLATAGLLELHGIPGIRPKGMGNTYKITKLGRDLTQHVLGEQPEE